MSTSSDVEKGDFLCSRETTDFACDGGAPNSIANSDQQHSCWVQLIFARCLRPLSAVILARRVRLREQVAAYQKAENEITSNITIPCKLNVSLAQISVLLNKTQCKITLAATHDKRHSKPVNQVSQSIEGLTTCTRVSYLRCKMSFVVSKTS